jgi:hypothetical protein
MHALAVPRQRLLNACRHFVFFKLMSTKRYQIEYHDQKQPRGREEAHGIIIKSGLLLIGSVQVVVMMETTAGDAGWLDGWPDTIGWLAHRPARLFYAIMIRHSIG